MMNVFNDLQGVERVDTLHEVKKRGFIKRTLKFFAKGFIFYVNYKKWIFFSFKIFVFISIYFLIYKILN